MVAVGNWIKSNIRGILVAAIGGALAILLASVVIWIVNSLQEIAAQVTTVRELVEPPPSDIIVDVVDDSFLLGGDDIDIVFANESDSPIMIDEDATLRVDEVYCPVYLRGPSPIAPGEIAEFVVDGSMRVTSTRIPDAVPQPCELRFDISRLGSDGDSETRFFDFMCERNRAPNLGISGSNLCE